MSAPRPGAVTVTVRHEGRRYRVERGPGVSPGTTREYWASRGVIGSERAWLGDRHTTRPTWYAAVNPTGQPYRASARVEGLCSRRAAVRWLLANAAQPVEAAEGPGAEGGESR